MFFYMYNTLNEMTFEVKRTFEYHVTVVLGESMPYNRIDFEAF